MRVFDFVTSVPWAIEPEWLRAILGVAAREAADPQQIVADLEAVAARKGRALAATERATIRDGVAIVPVSGPIFRYANLFTELSGATSVAMLAADLRAALDDPAAHSILLEIDSPGGEVSGINEFANMVRAAAAAKPLAAYVSYMGASAAYWIASAAPTVVIDATAQVGSIGVVMTYLDRSKADAARGYREVAFVSSQSPDKRPSPDDDTGRAVLQRRVDAVAQVFVDAVARFRGVGADTVVRDFGRGSVLVGAEAVAAGMADRLGSFEGLLAEMARAQALDASAFRVSHVLPSPAAALPGATGAGASPGAPTTAQHGEPDMSDPKPQGGPTPPTNPPAPTPAPAPAAAADAVAAAKAEAIVAERQRIKAIQGLALAGHEALMQRCIDDGSTPEQFAIAQTMAEKGKGAAYLEQRRENEKALAAVAPKAATDPAPSPGSEGAQGGAPESDEAAKKAWAADAKLRAEFASEGDYVAFAKAAREKRFKILTRTAA